MSGFGWRSFIAAVCVAIGTAASAQSPLPSDGAANTGLKWTHLFTQYNFYNTDSDENGLDYNYRANGLSTGANFRYGSRLAGFVYGGFMDATDDVSAPIPNHSDYNLPQLGAQLSYTWMPNVAVGGSILVQRIDGDFTSATAIGSKDGWGVSGGGFMQFSTALGGLWIEVTPALSAGRNRLSQPGPVNPFIGEGLTASLGLSARYSPTVDWTIGASVTPSWVVSETDSLADRAIGPFHTSLSVNSNFKLSDSLWLYSNFNYGIHGPDRTAQSAVVGLSWAIGP